MDTKFDIYEGEYSQYLNGLTYHQVVQQYVDYKVKYKTINNKQSKESVDIKNFTNIVERLMSWNLWNGKGGYKRNSLSKREGKVYHAQLTIYTCFQTFFKDDPHRNPFPNLATASRDEDIHQHPNEGGVNVHSMNDIVPQSTPQQSASPVSTVESFLEQEVLLGNHKGKSILCCMMIHVYTIG